jgi:hypothetical protein
VDWVAVAHPRTNGQVERANNIILEGLKPHILTQEGEDVHARLSARVRKWAAEVPSMLWSLRTTPNRSTNFTPFFMVCGAEAILPTNLDYGSTMVWAYQSDAAEEAQRDAIDLLKESRDTAVIRSVGYQHALQWYHACKVYPQVF